ncbi:MAG: hypothetical protein H6680_10645 [Desulfobacteraceae bacterium]|nr:hypothetical protein [Desulfobacteraceae bacterium]
MNKKYFFLIIIFFAFSLKCEALTTFTPGFSVSEDYTDNYNQDEFSKDKEEDFSTKYSLSLALNSETRTSKVGVFYSPSYVDSHRHDDNDSMEHSFSLNSLFNITKFTDINFSNTFSRSKNRSIRTGFWEDQDTYSAVFGASNRFAENSSIGISCSFTGDSYEAENQDEHKTYKVNTFINHWFNVKYGYSAGFAAEKTTYENDRDDKDTYTGNIKFSRKITKHFDTYLAYTQSYSIEDDETHQTYNPSAGFDWNLSETSRASLGFGVLFNKYSDQEDSNDLFVDADIYKFFDFSKRSSLSVYASSGYEETSEDVASLGFNIYYQGGFNYSYLLTRRVSLDFTGSYKIQDFKEEISERKDNTLDIGTGLSWTVFKWLNSKIYYSYTKFDTDAKSRGDYEENKAGISISIGPSVTPRIDTENDGPV